MVHISAEMEVEAGAGAAEAGATGVGIAGVCVAGVGVGATSLDQARAGKPFAMDAKLSCKRKGEESFLNPHPVYYYAHVINKIY